MESLLFQCHFILKSTINHWWRSPRDSHKMNKASASCWRILLDRFFFVSFFNSLLIGYTLTRSLCRRKTSERNKWQWHIDVKREKSKSTYLRKRKDLLVVDRWFLFLSDGGGGARARFSSSFFFFVYTTNIRRFDVCLFSSSFFSSSLRFLSAVMFGSPSLSRLLTQRRWSLLFLDDLVDYFLEK